jgi:acetyl/propionyl-CoA carboxylase alpha subunit
MAKLIARGADRDDALHTLRNALDALQVEGVRTNRDTLRHILAHPDFAHGAVTTRWLNGV